MGEYNFVSFGIIEADLGLSRQKIFLFDTVSRPTVSFVLNSSRTIPLKTLFMFKASYPG